jgi:hypothetical protein
LRIHTAFDQLSSPQFDVKRELLIDLLVDRYAPKP